MKNEMLVQTFITRYIQNVAFLTANIYYKSRNLPNTDIHNYSTDLR